MSKNRIIEVYKTYKAYIRLGLKKITELGRKEKIIMRASALMVVVICGALIFPRIGVETAETGTAEMSSNVSETEGTEPEIQEYYEIIVDGKPVIALASMEEAQNALDGVIARYSTKGSDIISIEYKENVDIGAREGENPSTVSPDEAVSYILTGTKEPKVHTVVKGDNLWDIAMKNGMKVEELVEANPDANPDNLKIGTILNLYELKPYIHVKVVERITQDERIDYKIQYEETDNLYKGEIQVKVAGVYGKREVTKELTKENGVTVDSKELGSTVISEPSTQVNLRGTKSLATLVGTGSFVNPMGRLEVSSPFGSRGGGRHTGVDLRNPKGTPIYVVDDGVVSFAKYSGTYGNIVKVSHGKGIETWYAHCDTMLVSIGDVVSKGQQIATVGITGRATGYHLHFEVRKNGVPQNPMNYL